MRPRSNPAESLAGGQAQSEFAAGGKDRLSFANDCRRRNGLSPGAYRAGKSPVLPGV